MSKEIKYKLFKPIATDKRLTFNEKLVAMFVYTLNYSGCTCTATNNYIANNLNITEDSVEIAVKRLEKYCLIKDSRTNSHIGYIEVCNTHICEKKFYIFQSDVLKSNLCLSSKFLLVYVQSFKRKDFKFFTQKNNLKENIGLTTQYQIKSALKELLDLKLLREFNNAFEGTYYRLYNNINTIN